MKLPEKYRFTGGVMGNGITLGLTDGTNNFALRTQGSDLYSFDRATTGYGQNVGTVVTGGTAGTANKLIGITTDPEKSGITLEKEPWIVFIAY